MSDRAVQLSDGFVFNMKVRRAWWQYMLIALVPLTVCGALLGGLNAAGSKDVGLLTIALLPGMLTIMWSTILSRYPEVTLRPEAFKTGRHLIPFSAVKSIEARQISTDWAVVNFEVRGKVGRVTLLAPEDLRGEQFRDLLVELADRVGAPLVLKPEVKALPIKLPKTTRRLVA